MALSYKVRDFFAPRKKILEEIPIREGVWVLDFGCGPGSYIVPLAKKVGPSGQIYALDAHPSAIEMVERLKAKKHLPNVTTIQSDGRTGLPDESLDVVLLYDVFHELEHPSVVLEELHRILKSSGKLSVSDHHLTEGEILSSLTERGFFQFIQKGRKTFTFQKSAQTASSISKS